MKRRKRGFDMDFMSPTAGFDAKSAVQPYPHIIDALIAERATKLSKHWAWPLMRPVFYKLFNYREAVELADAIAGMSGADAFSHISALLNIDVQVIGGENLPTTGAAILAPNHPTGLPDGIAIFDAVTTVRRDLMIFANRDAMRVSPGFSDLIIPVEWRSGEKSHSKSRDTLALTARAIKEDKAIVLFPSGRIAFWNEDRLTERPWQTSVVALPRRYQVPLIPVHMSGRNSGLFYWLSKQSTELRDMTIFHELLNKKRASFRIVFGKPVAQNALDGEQADVAARLQHFTTQVLAHDPQAEFHG
jgi:putative hemolysin